MAAHLRVVVSQELPERRGGMMRVRIALSAVGTLISMVVVIVGCLGVVASVATHFTPKSGLTIAKHPLLVVVSGSMTPVIRTGDLVIDDPLSDGEASHLHVGQIISFHRPAGSNRTITHRIYALASDLGPVAYITKGDANNAPDAEPVQPSQIVGLYAHKVSHGGYVLNALHRPLTLGFLLASPALWFISGLLFEWAKAVDEEDGEPAPAGEETCGTR